MNWKKILTREANVFVKNFLLKGICIGPTFVAPNWKGIRNQLWIWKSGQTGIHFLEEELQKYAEFIAKAAISDKTFVENYIKGSEDIIQKAIKSSEAPDYLSELKDEELLALLDTFEAGYIGLGKSIIMSLEELEGRLFEVLPETSIGDVITPKEISLESHEELDRIELAQYVKENHLEVFLQTPEKIVESVKDPEFLRMIEKHVKKYCWIPVNYEQEPWDQIFFIKRIKQMLEDKVDFESARKRISDKSELLARKEKIRKKLSGDYLAICDILEANSHIRLKRAYAFSQTLYNFRPVLKELAKRLRIDLKAITFMTSDEIKESLGKTLDAEKLRQRKNLFVMKIIDGVYSQFEGKEASRMIESISEEDSYDQKEVKGSVAYPGIVRGKVKVLLNASEMDKIAEGDILICEATNPDLVIVMNRAAAIVTNEGGITSHAAIVSREMKKPCIIGTKIATKVFKDGDLVEVDAGNGIVRRIK